MSSTLPITSTENHLRETIMRKISAALIAVLVAISTLLVSSPAHAVDKRKCTTLAEFRSVHAYQTFAQVRTVLDGPGTLLTRIDDGYWGGEWVDAGYWDSYYVSDGLGGGYGGAVPPSWGSGERGSLARPGARDRGCARRRSAPDPMPRRAREPRHRAPRRG